MNYFNFLLKFYNTIRVGSLIVLDRKFNYRNEDKDILFHVDKIAVYI